MNCTACSTGQLAPCFLEPGLRAHECNHCGGHWLYVEDVVQWKAGGGKLGELDQMPEVEETASALTCPVTGRLMQKYRIVSGSSHKLDYSPHTGGLWLDKGEWSLLKEYALAGSVGNIVTEHWQRKIRTEDAKASLEAVYRRKFGEANYRKLAEIRNWLADQENCAEMRAFLLARDPYSGR
ncbi:zf-TFIIB domain-containing protein [Simiduia sp. 21SJ11W-1]|uniref:zf-TFIIB domain-containing protein n=1 Tax=Simiduia sp. 21SJ11W-1 TaxID=2909669 RepID=UPI00209D86CC|nr:zf-TFIIB domain-containing protein [Simiduia sp. 21SJ11W-1]UTA48056.1 zf-TFIIB domain-containing protein [Simiduia sp. 21SJ11W-1]